MKFNFLSENGTGIKVDEKTAAVYYKKAADGGDIEALLFLGIAYEFGSGVDKDAFRAIEYYKRATDEGNIEALRRLGQCYANGTGVDKDLAFSFECYTKAANLGDEFSVFLLADCYHWGKGIMVNYSKALNFYKKYIDNCKYANENYAKANYEIGNICIIPEYQGRGIGTKILKDIIKQNMERNIKLQYFNGFIHISFS